MTTSLIALIMSLSQAAHIPPNLVMAIIQVESGGDAKAVGDHGEIGLMQIMPGNAKGTSRQALFDPETNIRVGISLLAEAKETCIHREGLTWVVCWNLGNEKAKAVHHPKLWPYYQKVMDALFALSL